MLRGEWGTRMPNRCLTRLEPMIHPVVFQEVKSQVDRDGNPRVGKISLCNRYTRKITSTV